MSRIIIIGASHAGLSCAERLRHHGFDGQITIFDREDGLPLQRPPLSKAYLKTEAGTSEEAFFLRKADWFEVFKIDFQPGCAVRAIDRKSGQIELADGRIEAYHQLVIATGASPR
ncbi:MAG: FAD-dependent oxidoreductase, partial [Candidatus Puniceispirillaceae bacterium]